ncbi:hypothetical protein [Hymenobacter psychrotolerans]|uniref:LTXXQ motif family protein n=1 Tax=Hymenobacter psychrotolerans DSM 18569 TaxID=1121959 RepID=A0A1M6UBE1_9BACT|nr:hypothetical protein [Hymenobacter psychrotolerans]SHK66481.1 hypothetical protein SAMN02746009_01303 [Hymenobacter psychrotolerans DSM 18569]
MKTTFFATLLLLSAPSLLLAQTTTTTVKTKTKPATGAPASKSKTTAATPRPATRPAPVELSEEAQAQVETRAKALTDNMQKALALNPQQVEKVRQINLISVRGVETSRLTYRQDVRKMASVVDDIGQSRLGALKDVLTPAQFDKYQRKREEKMGVPSGQAAQGNAAPGLGSRYEE